MPIYEYQCETCTFEFEELVRSGETVTCPHCRSSSVRRKLSTFATSNASGGSGSASSSATASSSGCGGCSGGHCSCCHH